MPNLLAETMVIRPAEKTDSTQVISLIDICFQAYPGCVLDLPDLDADLPKIPDVFDDAGGEFWVAEDKGKVVGCAGYVPLPRHGIELKRLYVHPAYRRLGLATSFLMRVIDAAEKRNAHRIELWSDTRFEEAHRFYERYGFTMPGEKRRLNDPSNTTEYLFILRLHM